MQSKKSMLARITALTLGISLLSGALLSSGIVTTADSTGTTEVKEDFEIDRNWARLLQHSIYFYDANMCGCEVTENNLYSWRNDCHTYDSQVPLDTAHTNLTQDMIDQYSDIFDPDGDGCVDVNGGFHDAGDHVKFGLPEAYAASTLAWGYYEFRDAYAQTGQDDHIETICRYFSDYFMRSTFRDENGDVISFCYQVGDGDIDHAYWQAPENDTMDRPAFFSRPDNPSTDNVSNSAASLAINYLNFKDTDPEYAEKCLDYAIALYDYATSFGSARSATSSDEGSKGYYTSSKWEDDYCFAACWLYIITKDHKYLEDCLPIVDYYAAPCYVYCWNDMWCGVSILLGIISDSYPSLSTEYIQATGKSPYEEIDFWKKTAEAINTYIKGGIGTITPAGYFWLNTWGSARYNTAAQFCAFIYDKYNDGVDKYNTSNPAYALSDWAKGQMEYLMGENPVNTCYVVGYCDNSVKYPHHRAASGLTKCEDTADHKHILYGALVGGPDAEDKHVDTTADWIYNEVTIDYNAAFVGASAALYYFYGDDSMEVDADFPPPDPGMEETDDTNVFGGDEYWVSAFCADEIQATGAGVSKITFYVFANATSPKTDISIKYFFDISEFTNGTDPTTLKASCVYDQAATEDGMPGKLTGPIKYDDDTYYIEVSWPGYTIANSNKKYQVILGLYYGDTWNTSNDWSHEGMPDVGSQYDSIQTNATEYAVRCDNICVYSNGALIGGTEPDGSTAAKVYSVNSYLRLMQGLDNCKVFPGPNFAGQYDLNSDNKANVIDALILKRLVTGIDS